MSEKGNLNKYYGHKRGLVVSNEDYYVSDNDKLISVCRPNDSTHVVLQTHKGLFLKFAIEEVPEKKKGAVGVRGMNLTENDLLEAVYYTQNAVENTINYKSKNLVLNSIKLGKRDTKGIKVRA